MDNQFDDLEVKAPELSFDIPVSTDLPAAAPVQTPEVKVPQEDLNLTEEEMLSEIQQYCEATDTVTSEHIELARECKLVSVPFTSGILNMTQQQFEEECGRLGVN